MNKIIFATFSLIFISLIKLAKLNSYQKIKETIVLSLSNKLSEIENELQSLDCNKKSSECLNKLINNDYNLERNSSVFKSLKCSEDYITINSNIFTISLNECNFLNYKFQSINITLSKEIIELQKQINHIKNKIINEKKIIPNNNQIINRNSDKLNNYQNIMDSTKDFFKQYAQNSDSLICSSLLNESNTSKNESINSNIIQFEKKSIENINKEYKQDIKFIQKKLNVMIETLTSIKSSKKKIISAYEKLKENCKINVQNKTILNMTDEDKDRFNNLKKEKIKDLNYFQNSLLDLNRQSINFCGNISEFCKKQRIKLIHEKEEINDFILYIKNLDKINE